MMSVYSLETLYHHNFISNSNTTTYEPTSVINSPITQTLSIYGAISFEYFRLIQTYTNIAFDCESRFDK